MVVNNFEVGLVDLYVMGSPRGAKKVGIAKNPALRMRAVRTGHSRPIELLFSAPAPDGLAVDIERRTHWLLREHKAHGEWFNVSAKTAIEALQRAIIENGAGEKEPPSVGRPPLKRNVETVITSIRLTAPVAARIDVIAGPNKRSDFIREAIEKELKRREREIK